MNKEEVAYKLLELYFTSMYKSFNISLDDFIEKYKKILESIKKEIK